MMRMLYALAPLAVAAVYFFGWRAGAVLAVVFATGMGTEWITSRRMRAMAFGWGIVIGGVLATIAHGLHQGSLPGTSLSFRWAYWSASSELIADHQGQALNDPPNVLGV